jgi:hypothetical protein
MTPHEASIQNRRPRRVKVVTILGAEITIELTPWYLPPRRIGTPVRVARDIESPYQP